MRGKLGIDPARLSSLGVASMRPALYARETIASPMDRNSNTTSFNEARALCAGNLV